MTRQLPLTEKQERVWRYIRSCERSPTIAEMERDLGMGRCAIARRLDALEERHYISRIRYRARGIVALDPQADLAHFPTEALAAEIARRLR